MPVTAARYANWKAPAQDGLLTLWPNPAQLLSETRDNAKYLGSIDSARVQGIPISQLRKNVRTWLGHTDNDRPLIATGHQTELHHPGVWVKNAIINTIAQKVDGQAYHFAVDTDQPKHLSVRWPGSSIAITDDPSLSSDAWSGLLAPPTPVHIENIQGALESAASCWNFAPMLGKVLDSLRRSSLDSPNLSAAITDSQHQLDWDLGLKHHVMLVSPMLSSETYLVFVHHVLGRAQEFACDYNAALADYRTEAGITSLTRPMPDLQINSDTVEVPFWLDDLATGTRSRAQVHRATDGWKLSVNQSDFVFQSDADGHSAAESLRKWLATQQLRLSPRALTLTTFLRLLVVDQFVHGIGGGRYDQVTDRLLETHFKIDPPRFAVATATLFFPGAVGRSRVCMPCLAMEGHRLKHNLLGLKKRGIVEQITALPRKSIARSLAFHNMHSALSAATVDNPVLKEWATRSESSQLLAREEQVLFDRELFYAMQSRQRLLDLIEQCDQSFSQ